MSVLCCGRTHQCLTQPFVNSSWICGAITLSLPFRTRLRQRNWRGLTLMNDARMMLTSSESNRHSAAFQWFIMVVLVYIPALSPRLLRTSRPHRHRSLIIPVSTMTTLSPSTPIRIHILQNIYTFPHKFLQQELAAYLLGQSCIAPEPSGLPPVGRGGNLRLLHSHCIYIHGI